MITSLKVTAKTAAVAAPGVAIVGAAVWINYNPKATTATQGWTQIGVTTPLGVFVGNIANGNISVKVNAAGYRTGIQNDVDANGANTSVYFF